jgi:hypothetical protein
MPPASPRAVLIQRGPSTRTMVARALLVLLGALLGESRLHADSDGSFTIRFETVVINQLAPGVTFGVTVDDTPQADNALTQETLKSSTAYQNQHILGWGGWYTNDSTLDINALTNLVNRMPGPEKIITLCCALPSQRVDAANVESRPRDDAFDEFAAMAGDVARRFAGDVKYYQVWNEMKGFWLSSPGRWDADSYCVLYNKVYDTVKMADPNALVGGPYVVLNVDAARHKSVPDNPHNFRTVNGVADGRDLEAIDQWLQCAQAPGGGFRGDFLVIDVRNLNRQNKWPVNPFRANEVFEQVAARMRQLLDAHEMTLPIWAAEWYSVSPKRLSIAQSAALQMSGMRSLALGGYARAPLWYPEGDSTGLHDKQGLGTSGLWTMGGTATTPLAEYFQQFKNGFPAGSHLYPVEHTGGARDVQVLAGQTQTMLINTQGSVKTIRLNEKRFALKPYEVRFIDTATLRGNTSQPQG